MLNKSRSDLFEFLKLAATLTSSFLKLGLRFFVSSNYKTKLNAHSLIFKTTSRYILGFKLHCLGRFTRKQRAASFWLRHGILSPIL